MALPIPTLVLSIIFFNARRVHYEINTFWQKCLVLDNVWRPGTVIDFYLLIISIERNITHCDAVSVNKMLMHPLVEALGISGIREQRKVHH